MLETLDILITFSALMFAFSLVTSGLIKQVNDLTRQKNRVYRNSLRTLAKQTSYVCLSASELERYSSLEQAIQAESNEQRLADKVRHLRNRLLLKLNNRFKAKHRQPDLRFIPSMSAAEQARTKFECYLSQQLLKTDINKTSHFLTLNTYLSITEEVTTLDERTFDEPRLTEIFEEFEQVSSANYRSRTQYINLFFSALITLSLQINSFDLLYKLSVEEDFKKGLLPVAENVAADPLTTFADINHAVNNRFIQTHQQTHQKVEQLSSGLDNQSIQQAMEEFDIIFKHSEPQLRRDYQAALTEEYQAHQEDIADLLAEFNFELLPEGVDYFYQVKHYPGLFLSIVLISFGAPFWYKVLHGLMSARSVFLPFSHREPPRQKHGQYHATPAPEAEAKPPTHQSDYDVTDTHDVPKVHRQMKQHFQHSDLEKHLKALRNKHREYE